VHMAVTGFPGFGKSRFLLSLAVQDVRRGRGVLLIDPHGDLAKLFLTHIPRERWDDVIYIDPTTAKDYGKVVKINFLEVKDPKDRDIVARCFMESLEKIYARHWGPRLDMILMNAVYALLDSGDTNLTHLYNIIADETFRESCLQRVGDERVKNFWENEFKKMPRDAGSAVLTKIYRIVQERIVAPMFECERSGFDFRRAMDEGKIIVVNLSEGAITSDVANFLGSLILSRVYLAGMSRENVPEQERRPFYVYVDEAYRFVSDSIRDILQSLRKYRVYMTLASQYLTQYKREIAESIPHLCDAMITFSTGEDTAKRLQEFFRPHLNYSDIMHLPKFVFAASAVVGGKRECQVLRSIDLKHGPNKPDEIIAYSLNKEWAEPVDMSRLTGIPIVGELDHPTNRGFKNPTAWIIALKLYGLYAENLGRGMGSQGSMPAVERGELIEAMQSEFGVQPAHVDAALNQLVYLGYVHYRDKNYEWDALAVPTEAKWQTKPQLCHGCGELTYRPYYLKSGRAMCKLCLEKALYTGRCSVDDVVEPRLEADKIRADQPIRRRSTKRFFYITMRGVREVEQIPTGRRGGGPEHTLMIAKLQELFWGQHCWVRVDEGEETPRMTEDGKEEYEAKRMPDLIVVPITRNPDGKWNPRFWDNAHIFTVEVEINPIKHSQRVVKNLIKNRNFGKPVIFVTSRDVWANRLVDILHNELGEDVVYDCTGLFGGVWDNTKVSVLYFNPETGERVFLTNDQLLPIAAEQIEQAEPKGAAETSRAEEPSKAGEPRVEESGKVEEPSKAGGPGRAEEPSKAEEPVTSAPANVEERAAEEKKIEEKVEKGVDAGVDAPVGPATAVVQADDVRQFYSIFTREPWRLVKQETEDGKIMLAAEAKVANGTVVVTLGPYENHEKALRLLGIEPPFRPCAKKSEGKTGPLEEEAPKDTAPANLEETIKHYQNLGYSFSIKTIRGRQWLYAQKREEGKVKSRSIAAWNENVAAVAKRLEVRIGKTEEPHNAEDSNH